MPRGRTAGFLQKGPPRKLLSRSPKNRTSGTPSRSSQRFKPFLHRGGWGFKGSQLT